MSKAKAQGTALETGCVRDAEDVELRAWRYAEGGANDVGDVGIYADVERVHECKARERLNVHAELAKAMVKADPHPVTLVWKKLTRKPGNSRRTPDGVATVAVLPWDDYLVLLHRASLVRDYDALSERFAEAVQEVGP